MTETKLRKFPGEVYRTKPVEIPEELQGTYGMPDKIPYIVKESHGKYSIACICQIVPYEAYQILEKVNAGKIFFGYKEKDGAIRVAENLREDLAKLVKEFN